MGRVFEIVGWTLDGEAYCANHEPDDNDNEEAAPVFLGEGEGLTCEECGEPLEEAA